ncbi:MAG: AAA family ATPase [Proteobacteria bacterium]|nr:AAA family ATPase [Pseudomonadota bacterium]
MNQTTSKPRLTAENRDIPPSVYHHKVHGKPQILAHYANENDETVFYVAIWYPKGKDKIVLPFCYEAQNGEAIWTSNWPTKARPLYHLPRLISRSAKPVLIVEGEKTADAASLIFTDLVVTTTSGGSNSASKTDLLPLCGRDVIIWPDNDKPGEKYCNRLTALLSKIGVKSVRVVNVPKTFPTKWDLADPLPTGVQETDLYELIQKSESIEVIDTDRELKLTSLEHIVEEPIEYIWEPYIPRGNLTIFDGDPGTGKSTLLLALASAISNGVGLSPNHFPKVGKTLFLSCEDSLPQRVVPGLKAYQANIEQILWYEDAFTLDQEGLLKLKYTAEKWKPDLVVIDPIVAYIGEKVDTNTANKVRGIIGPLAKLARSLNCAILAVRHLNKDSNGGSLLYRGQGSIDFIAAARSGMAFVQNPEIPNSRILVHHKSNLSALGPSIEFEFREGKLSYLGASQLTARDWANCNQTNRPLREIEKAAKIIQETLEEGIRPSTEVKEVAKKNGITEGTFWRAVKSEGIIRKKSAGKNGCWTMQAPKAD